MKRASRARRHAPAGCALVGALLAAQPATPARALTIDGFAKNFFIVESPPAFEATPGAPPPPKSPGLVANNLRARLNIGAEPLDWLEVRLSYDLVPRWQDDDFARLTEELIAGLAPAYRVDDFDPVLVPRELSAGDNWIVLHNVDRAYVAVSARRFDLYLGRQAVAWGSARGINPTDVVAPFLFTDIDTEDRVGVDAARLRVPAGAMGEVDAGYVAGDDFSSTTSAVFLRGKHYVAQTDVALLVVRFRRHAMVGLDLSRALGGAGFWFEGANVWLDDDARRNSPVAGTGYDICRYARFSAGLDYSLADATYLFVEYHYSEAGASDPDGYRFVSQSPAFTDGSVYLLGRHYVIPGVTFPATPLLSLTLTSLVNLGEGSVLVAPGAEYSVSDNVYAAVGAFVGVGPSPAFDPPAPVGADGSSLVDAAATRFGSEFGAYPDTFFASLRYYF